MMSRSIRNEMLRPSRRVEPIPIELTPTERRNRDMHTRMLKAFDPKDPEKGLMEVLEHIALAVEQGDERSETALRGVESVMLDERLRFRLFETWKEGKESKIDLDYVDWILDCYRKFLRRRDSWPKELADKLSPKALAGLYVDLLANKQFLVGEEGFDQKELAQARKGLSDVFLSEPQLGKQVEWGLIGLLRYGPSLYANGSLSETPDLFVAHTLPEEDLYRALGVQKKDIVLRLPGYQMVDSYALKSTDETHAGELNLIGPEVRWCFERIADRNTEMTPLEWKEWRNRYREVIEDFLSQMQNSVHEHGEKIEKLRAILLPRAKRQKVEKVPEANIDKAFSLRLMAKYWSETLKLFPDFEQIVGASVTAKNFSQAKQALKQMHEEYPELEIWNGWVEKKERKPRPGEESRIAS